MGTITHEGKLYRKVERRAKEGDRWIVPKHSERDVTAGKVYPVMDFSVKGNPKILDDVLALNAIIYDIYVLEPVSADPTESIMLISTTPAVEKTYTILLTEHTMGELINALRYFA
ncbi:hypothetical protein O0536_25175, partial [Brevibacillus laterosporus]